MVKFAQFSLLLNHSSLTANDARLISLELKISIKINCIKKSSEIFSMWENFFFFFQNKIFLYSLVVICWRKACERNDLSCDMDVSYDLILWFSQHSSVAVYYKFSWIIPSVFYTNDWDWINKKKLLDGLRHFLHT